MPHLNYMATRAKYQVISALEIYMRYIPSLNSQLRGHYRNRRRAVVWKNRIYTWYHTINATTDNVHSRVRIMAYLSSAA